MQTNLPRTVSFTAMKYGTRDDYKLVFDHAQGQIDSQSDRVLAWLAELDGASPYQVSRLEHMLQTATRAEKDGADVETIVCALLHDIGDILAPANHSQVAAALLRPYVSDRNYWIVNNHGLFQGYYYFGYYGKDPNLRDRHVGHPFYDDCARFCEDWDQSSFDPTYTSFPLGHFEPMVREVLGKAPRDIFAE